MATRTAPAKATSGKAAAKVIDFGNVKERGNFNTKHVDDGDYSAKVTKVEFTEAKDGEDMWVFSIVLDEHPRATYPYYCKLVENQLWKLKNIFEAAGISVGSRKVKVDPNKLIGKAIGVAMEDDDYEGRLKSVIAEVFPEEEVGGAVDGEEEDGADLEEDDIEEEEEKPAKRKPAAKKKAAPIEDDEDEEDEEDEDEEEEEEEEEKPAPKKRPAKKAPAKKAPARKRRPADDEEEDDEDMEIDEL